MRFPALGISSLQKVLIIKNLFKKDKQRTYIVPNNTKFSLEFWKPII